VTLHAQEIDGESSDAEVEANEFGDQNELDEEEQHLAAGLPSLPKVALNISKTVMFVLKQSIF
jgi:hypothetical protein